MEYPDIADLLQDTLDEEGDTDRKLTKLAEGGMFSKGLNEKAPK
jgi:ferritin-like metal-binding protein YciE